MDFDLIKPIADAILYEGYILYPYRASAVKNQHRFNFGVLVPPAPPGAPVSSEASTMQTECLLEGDDAELTVRVRFLQPIAREVYQSLGHSMSADAPGTLSFGRVTSLEVAGQTYHTWQEVVERDIELEPIPVRELVAQHHRKAFAFQETENTELLLDERGEWKGKIVRRKCFIEGIVELRSEQLTPGLFKITVAIENISPVNHQPDAAAHMQSFVSTHTMLGSSAGRFVSLLDPPDEFKPFTSACQNIGTWPVLAGKEPERNTLLSSPIILYDYPEIALESDGDFFDGTEIDEMLALRVMTLTDEEKLEMRAVDERACQILDRTEALPQQHWEKLHGALRSSKPKFTS